MTMMPRVLFTRVFFPSALFTAACGLAAAQGAATATYGPYWQPPVVKGGPVKRLPDGKPDMTGYWAPRFNQAIFDIENHPQRQPGVPPGKGAIVDPPDGKIPYKPEAAAKAKDLREHHIYEEPEAHCFESGVPHSAYQQFGFQILQPSGYFLIAFEYAHSYRIIPTDGRPHIASNVKLFMGDSVGHWEGDTLVVDTTNQNGRSWFDMVGNFTTENIHVVERITPVDANTINYEATIEDPTIYTRPWKIAGNWGRRIDSEYEQLEFACDEGNDDLQHYTEATGGTAKAVK
jgi:hypothetical protein